MAVNSHKGYDGKQATSVSGLKRDEIFALARQARLMFDDANMCYLNDVATDKELVAFVRLVEATVRIKLSCRS